ncbi:MAG: 50S ribosomal protein L11 methyltransferase [Patescibacteria group bacterium]|nr:50S ribosomal protein L11 methyltransferase [Patescibacteria group bacterium]MDE2588504.1 50S ribosomal protein L11 methyltransferase [Patescibacteria group bacterium]
MGLPLIPYFQTTRYRVTAMIQLAKVTKNDHAADLGSGDGRIAISLAKAGAEVVGYELDDKLVHLSQDNINREKLEKKVQIMQKDFWQEDLSTYSIITVYPMPDIMSALEEKLLKELIPGSRVLLNYYPFPTWKPTAVKDHIYLYIR